MLASIGHDIVKAAEILKGGGLVGIPTETVYGLAANGLDLAAVTKIFEAKNRPTFDPLILHVDSIIEAKKLTTQWCKTAQKLAEAFWPGPLTLVLPKSDIVSNLVTADNPTVAIRIPNNKIALDLLGLLPFPLAAPSANPFGYVSPTTAQHVADQLSDRIDYILDGGQCEVGLESTIVSIIDNKVTVLRLGGLSIDKIQEVLGQRVHESLSSHSNPMAPGQLNQHYSPACKVIPLEKVTGGEYRGWLFFSRASATQAIENLKATRGSYTLPDESKDKLYFLSETGDLSQAAQNLFALLRQFDKDHCETVFFEWAPDRGLGRAINDRLKRASAK